jgi:hypothetical protein
MAKDEEFEVDYYVCSRSCAIPGSIKDKCSQCGCDVWLSLETKKLYLEKPAPILCSSCALKLGEED